MPATSQCPFLVSKLIINFNTFVSSLVRGGTPRPMTQCFDIYSLLRAINRTHVNYFSLDVEGAELSILKTIPFRRITVDIFSVEYAVWGNIKESLARLQKVRNFFKDTGLYKELGSIPPGERKGVDVIFKKRNAWSPFYGVVWFQRNTIKIRTWPSPYQWQVFWQFFCAHLLSLQYR